MPTINNHKQAVAEVKPRGIHIHLAYRCHITPSLGIFNYTLNSILESIQVCSVHSMTAFFGVESIQNGLRLFHGGDAN